MADSHCFEGTHGELQKSDQKPKTSLYLGTYFDHMTHSEIHFNNRSSFFTFVMQQKSHYFFNVQRPFGEVD